MSDSDRSLRCAEYVLGTLSAVERAALERDMAADPGLRAEVERWEDWLADMNDLVPEVAPPSAAWPEIERRRASVPVAATSTPAAPVVSLDALRRSRGRWRAGAIVTGALAAGLALFAGRGLLRPQGASFLAVVNRGGELPALIVRVDTGSQVVSVRSLAAETPPDRSLELWYIAGSGPPRSVGLLGSGQTRAALPPGGPVADATFAVSVEPRGGSPTGAPTGQVIYSGKLVPDE